MPNTFTTGDRVVFIGNPEPRQVWEVITVTAVTEPYNGDPNYRQRLNIGIYEANGVKRLTDCWTGIRNTEVELA